MAHAMEEVRLRKEKPMKIASSTAKSENHIYPELFI